ncbi:MAG: glycosyltransferase family 9 protein [bacterium]|nr:glycosyltransferase family 9 protein [bacterium]
MGLIGWIHSKAKQLPGAGRIRDVLSSIKKPIHAGRLRKYADDGRTPSGQPSVLVVMNTGIGNAVEATPLVQSIRTLWPKSHITIYGPGGDLFENWCVVDEVTTFPDPLSGRKFDHTFEIWAVDPPIPESEAYPEKGMIHSLPFTGTYFLKPEREYNLDMIRKLGYRGNAPPLYVSLKRPRIEIPECKLRVSLVPGSNTDFMWRHKRWPYFTELLGNLLDAYAGVQVCIIGGPEDKFDNPYPEDSRVIDFRGRLSLSETAWLLRSSDLAIGNDCGPMHIADAAQTRSIILFGPSCELKNGPMYKSVPLSVPVPCRPCQYGELLLKCEDPRCMKELRPKLVLEQVRQMLPPGRVKGTVEHE